MAKNSSSKSHGCWFLSLNICNSSRDNTYSISFLMYDKNVLLVPAALLYVLFLFIICLLTLYSYILLTSYSCTYFYYTSLFNFEKSFSGFRKAILSSCQLSQNHPYCTLYKSNGVLISSSVYPSVYRLMTPAIFRVLMVLNGVSHISLSKYCKLLL